MFDGIRQRQGDDVAAGDAFLQQVGGSTVGQCLKFGGCDDPLAVLDRRMVGTAPGVGCKGLSDVHARILTANPMNGTTG